jgi:O-antigen ligase
VTAVAAPLSRAVAVSRSRLLDWLLYATAFCVTFEKIHWNVAGNVELADLTTIAFLVVFALKGRGRGTRTVVAVLTFFAAFLVVYLVGYYNIETTQALDQFGKGMVKFVLHWLFLVAAVAYVARRPPRFYWHVLGAFVAGMVVNAVYGVLQLLAARGGVNLDHAVLSPLTGGASSINVYGAVNGQSVYRPNALTGDPNHLGIMLDIPLLALLPVYLRFERRHRLRVPLAVTLAFLLIVELATLSRSGLLGLGLGLLVLAVPYRRFLRSRALLYPLLAVVVVLGVVVWERRHFFSVVIRSRFQTGGSSESAHFAVYNFIPQILHSHPLLGLGLNDFSVYYQFVTGKTNWGPHSFYVALIVESGLVGAALFLAFLWFLFARLAVARRLGRALVAVHEVEGRRVLPLAWGMTAALAGTMAANAFYLTMSFYYFFGFAVLVLTLPLVFGRAPNMSR